VPRQVIRKFDGDLHRMRVAEGTGGDGLRV
jgi:hypothetical protein